jgi:hypothetical protein
MFRHHKVGACSARQNFVLTAICQVPNSAAAAAAVRLLDRPLGGVAQRSHMRSAAATRSTRGRIEFRLRHMALDRKEDASLVIRIVGVRRLAAGLDSTADGLTAAPRCSDAN